MKVTMADGVELDVYDSGGDDPAVVLLHAWGLHRQMWSAQIARLLDAKYRVIALDRRGHGRSDVPRSGYDLDTLGADVETVIDATAPDEMVLVGHSFGGLEVARVATGRWRHRIVGAVFSGTVTPCLMQSEDNPTGVPAALFAEARALMRDDLEAWISANTAGYFGAGPDRPAAVTWTQQAIMSVPLDVLLATNATMVAADVRPALAAISCPTLVVHGAADLSAPRFATADPTAALLADSTVAIVDGAGHGLYTSHVAVYDEHLQRFLAAVFAPTRTAVARSVGTPS